MSPIGMYVCMYQVLNTSAERPSTEIRVVIVDRLPRYSLLKARRVGFANYRWSWRPISEKCVREVADKEILGENWCSM